MFLAFIHPMATAEHEESMVCLARILVESLACHRPAVDIGLIELIILG